METLMKELNEQCNNLCSYIANALNESKYDFKSDALLHDVYKMKFFNELGCFTMDGDYGTIYFPEGVYCPDEIISFINKLKKECPMGLHFIYGNFYGGSKYFDKEFRKFSGYISFRFMSKDKDPHVEPNYNLYHVCPGKHVESIRKNGLIPNTMQFDKNDKVINKKTKFSFQVFCYKAIFGVYKFPDCKRVAKDLCIQDPHIVKFKPKNTTWYIDYHMNMAYENKVTSSVFTYDAINPEWIVDISKMK